MTKLSKFKRCFLLDKRIFYDKNTCYSERRLNTLLKNSYRSLTVINSELDSWKECRNDEKCSAISFKTINNVNCFLFGNNNIRKYSKNKKFISIFKLSLKEFDQNKNLSEGIMSTIFILCSFLLIIFNLINILTV